MTNEQTTSWSARVEQVYHELGRELWARFYTHCCDPERAYDALQEAFTRLQQQNGVVIHDVRSWLLKVGQNWLRDVARRKSNSTRTVDRLDFIADDEDDPLNRLAGQELQATIRQALNELRTEDREVLVLRYALDWSSQRIAQTLEINASAVDMRLSRARRRLAALLEKAGINHESY